MLFCLKIYSGEDEVSTMHWTYRALIKVLLYRSVSHLSSEEISICFFHYLCNGWCFFVTQTVAVAEAQIFFSNILMEMPNSL